MSDREYDNTDSGALFQNDKKKSDKHPDYRGTLNVGGVEYWISGWKKTSRSGDPYMSLAVTEKEGQQSRGRSGGRRDDRRDDRRDGAGFDRRDDDRDYRGRSDRGDPPARAARAPARRDLDDEIPF